MLNIDFMVSPISIYEKSEIWYKLLVNCIKQNGVGDEI